MDKSSTSTLRNFWKQIKFAESSSAKEDDVKDRIKLLREKAKERTAGYIRKNQEEDFQNIFKDSIAINLGSTVIKRGASAQVFIITREAHD